MKTLIVIPARFASTRFPGKPLVLLLGKPLVQWVWERAMKCRRADRVVVATDDARIYRAVEFFGGEAIMTSPSHPSGTDRIAEVARRVRADLYVNLQGDEPAADPREIDRLIAAAARSRADIATLTHPLVLSREIADPNCVKVIADAQGRALYFSRAPIPYHRDAGKRRSKPPVYWRHIGIYAYRALR